MPISAEHQRAKRHQVMVSEPTYIVESGDSNGIKYRHIVQYGRDLEFRLNHNQAAGELDNIACGKPLPIFRGKTLRGRFSKRSMFQPTWARVFRGAEIIAHWGSPPQQSGDSL